MSIEGYPDCRHLTNCAALASQLNEVTLIDLRPAEDFAHGHIEGARSLDIYGFGKLNTVLALVDGKVNSECS